MILHDQVRADLTSAMKIRREPDLTVLRSVMTAFVNELVASRRKPEEKLADEEALTVIKRLAKQRHESAEQYAKAERADLTEAELAEEAILRSYLPSMMSEGDIMKIAMKKKEETGIDDRSKMGILMAELMKDLRGKADGAVVRKVVDKLFL
jgi:uncharacterized protein